MARHGHARVTVTSLPRTITAADTAAKATNKKQEEQSIKDGFKVQRDGYNLEYTMNGDNSIAPINVWDNNEFTSFKFPGNTDLPSIYYVDKKGHESRVEFQTTGAANNVLVVHKVSKQWYFRLGDSVLAVHNEKFDPIGVENRSRTASPAVVRRLKKEP